MMTMTENRNDTIDIALDEHPDLRISLEETGREKTIVMRLSGLIDTYNSEYFRSQATKVVEEGYPNIIFDTSATTFMSSTGIGAFTALLKVVKDKQGSMIIFGMPAKIYEVFQLLGFSSFFRFCSTRDEALSMLSMDTDSPSVFPMQITCPVCRRNLKAVKSGRFRCSSCRVILVVKEEGEIQLG